MLQDQRHCVDHQGDSALRQYDRSQNTNWKACQTFLALVVLRVAEHVCRKVSPQVHNVCKWHRGICSEMKRKIGSSSGDESNSHAHTEGATAGWKRCLCEPSFGIIPIRMAELVDLRFPFRLKQLHGSMNENFSLCIYQP